MKECKNIKVNYYDNVEAIPESETHIITMVYFDGEKTVRQKKRVPKWAFKTK